MIKRRNKYMTDWSYPNYFEDGGGLYGRPDTSLGLTTQQMLQRDGQQMLDYGKQLADQKNQQMMQDFNKSQNFQTIGKIGGALLTMMLIGGNSRQQTQAVSQTAAPQQTQEQQAAIHR